MHLWGHGLGKWPPWPQLSEERVTLFLRHHPINYLVRRILLSATVLCGMKPPGRTDRIVCMAERSMPPVGRYVYQYVFTVAPDSHHQILWVSCKSYVTPPRTEEIHEDFLTLKRRYTPYGMPFAVKKY